MGIVAAVQTPSVYLDSMAGAKLAAERIAEAAEHGAWLAVFPETFIPGDPFYHDNAMLDSEPFRVLERRFAQQAITVPGPETECIAAACRAHHMTVAIGVTERPARAGTLYNTLLYFGPDGTILGRHRKLMPTYNERMVWGMGDGTTLRTIETPQGIIGGLICWENYMPLARTVLYAQGEQIHVAPTLNPGNERWLAAMRQIANEGRMWVISVGCLLRESDLPPEVKALGLVEKDAILNAGGSAIVNPNSEIVAGPAYGVETILYTEADMAETLYAKRTFDAVGHYGRADLFGLTLRGMDIPLHIGDSSPLAQMSGHVWRVPQRVVASDATQTEALE
ncbi:MAG TPA: carbon-nitrogen hydrolase family protein [Ktedonobacteraceae bacterium]|nr:carbon-nitrogen hydrolase family protein [Ktedonobacteraceae bacterium]